jgi:ankyrin repeat protein
MFRNNYSKTQTQTQTPTPTLTRTTTLRGTTNSTNSGRNNLDNEILFAILTSNFQEVKRLVEAPNVNNIIDTTNNYTALHHAVRVRGNDNIVEYLMSIGADPKIKQSEGKDAIDLSIEANYRFLIDKLLKEKETELDKIYDKFDTINYEFKNLEKKNKELKEENDYMKKSSSQYVETIESLKYENTSLKRKYEESEEARVKSEEARVKSDKAFENLLKKYKKN